MKICGWPRARLGFWGTELGAEMVDTAAGKSPGLPRSTALAAPKPLELGVPFRAASPPIAA